MDWREATASVWGHRVTRGGVVLFYSCKSIPASSDGGDDALPITPLPRRGDVVEFVSADGTLVASYTPVADPSDDSSEVKTWDGFFRVKMAPCSDPSSPSTRSRCRGSGRGGGRGCPSRSSANGPLWDKASIPHSDSSSDSDSSGAPSPESEASSEES
ncbi:hypothetical protein Pelo_3699 [Pelomyxa schiedti]|nr:hypothetical protein Pelo_3699 [Pelomyxa schiedti]